MIICVICIALVLIVTCGVAEYNSDQFPLSGLIGFVFLVVILIMVSNEPRAIDVYKGKTILEVTYRDSIPVDSTVVFKYK